jgi:uncharacterized protein
MNSAPEAPDTDPITATRRWVERVVIGLNLCPFAKAVHGKGQVRYVLSQTRDAEALLADLVRECERLRDTPAEVLDTTLLVHPEVLGDFLDYNDFLDIADAALIELGLEGVLQIASFHPDYRFADSDPDDIENHTNRSPYPMLHLLREDSIDRAVAAYPEPDAIIERNLETMRRLGPQGLAALLAGDSER